LLACWIAEKRLDLERSFFLLSLHEKSKKNVKKKAQ